MYKKVLIGLFAAFLCLFFALTVLCPRDENASVKENRPLAEMPVLSWDSWFSGKFGADFEEYLSDNVGFRSFFTDLGARLEKLRGFVRPAKGQLVTLPSGGQLALHDGKIMEVFRTNPEAEAAYAAALNDLSAALPAGTEMYLALAPTQIEFVDSPYKTLSDSEKDAINGVYAALSGITSVNVYDRIAESEEPYLYFRTDHHWTQRGAYQAYAALMETMGETPVPLTEMTGGRRQGFLGYLYNQANVPEYAEFADEIEYFYPDDNYTVHARALENGAFVDYSAQICTVPPEGTVPAYALFMGGDHAFAWVDTDVDNGKCALVIKDSYANALLPFLTAHYETVLVIDPRSFYGTLSDLTSEYEIHDVIVVNYVFTATFTDFIENLKRIG